MPSFVPSTAAPTHLGRFRSDATARSVAGLGDQPGAQRLGGPFLPDVFPRGGQSLEAAFGADLSADPSTWVFTDVTTPYVQWNPGVAIQIGSVGTAAKRLIPSSLTATLLNDQDGGGDWTIGNATGRWGSQLRENTPIRGRLDLGSGAVDRFCGYLTSVPPTRTAAGGNFVALTAHGAARQIAKGKSAAFSALRKSLGRALPNAYWPLEKGAGGTVGASAVSGVPDMTVTAGSVSFGTADDSLPSSLPLAQFNRDGVAGQLTGVIPAQFSAAIVGAVVWSVEFVMKSSTLGAGESVAVVDWNVRGTIDLWGVFLTPAGEGGLKLQYVNTSGGTASFTSSLGFDDGEWHHVRIDCQQTAGIAVQATVDGTQIISQSTTGTNGEITTVIVNPLAESADTVPSVGHFAVWNGARPNTENTYDAFLGHAGDTVAERMLRLAAEAGVTLDIIGVADDHVGPQRAGAFLDLLQDAIDVDAGGILTDGISWGLTYYTRQSAYSAEACLTVDSADGDFPSPLPATHSDQGRVNKFTASDPLTNADRTFEQTAGPMGSDPVTGVGTYDDGGQFRVNVVDQLDQLAAWTVGQGTVPGLRWPAIPIELAKPATSAKAADWLACHPLCRVDARGISTGYLPDRSLILRGWVERWNSRRWWLVLSTGTYDEYAVSTIATDSGDISEFTSWYEVDEDVVTAGPLSAGGVAVTVNLSSTGTVLTHPAVSTYADDLLGLYVNLDGLKVGVTAISAPSGGQQIVSLTGSDVVRPVPAGTALLAWDPFVAGL